MRIPDIIKLAARELRKNSIVSEVILWNNIKNWKLGVKFLRQKPIYVFTENSWLDRFIIPDFFCFEKKLIIEVDGGVHELQEVYILDREKENLLINMWFKIIRFTNKEIKNNIWKVLEKLRNEIN